MKFCADGQTAAIQALVLFQFFLQTHLKRYCNTTNKRT